MTSDKDDRLTIMEAVIEATKRLHEAQVASPALDARLLLTHVIEDTPDILLRAPEQFLSNDQLSAFQSLVSRRTNREPVSHLIGKRGFWNSDFIVNSHVLDPRPDSETLIETVLKRMPNKRSEYNILDLGTGSGCLILSLLQEFPNASGVAVDISDQALTVAKANAQLLELNSRISFLQGSWFEGLSGHFDIIISNPPYIETDEISKLQTEVREYEPISALDGGEDGFHCYNSILSNVLEFMPCNGLLVFEVGKGQAAELVLKMQNAGLQKTEISNDLAGIERIVSGFKKN